MSLQLCSLTLSAFSFLTSRAATPHLLFSTSPVPPSCHGQLRLIVRMKHVKQPAEGVFPSFKKRIWIFSWNSSFLAVAPPAFTVLPWSYWQFWIKSCKPKWGQDRISQMRDMMVNRQHGVFSDTKIIGCIWEKNYRGYRLWHSGRWLR